MNGESYHARGAQFCAFKQAVLMPTVNLMLLEDRYNLDICVMSFPSMVQVPYC